MINGKISGKQAVNMMILFILGSSIATGGSLITDQDSWISLLLGIVLSIPVALLYASMHKLQPDKNLYDLSYMVFGRIGGAIITFLFSAYAIYLGTLVIKNFTEYIHVVSSLETSQFLVAVSICLIMYFTVVNGIEVLGRGSVFVLPFTMFIVAFLILFSIRFVDIDNIKPILYSYMRPVLTNAYTVLVFPFAETVLFTVVFSSVETKSHPAKLYLSAILSAGIVLLIIMVTNTMVLGYPLIKSLYFPSYARAGIIEVGKFFTRVEILLTVNFIIFNLVKTTVCLYVGCNGFAKLFKLKDYKWLAAFLALSMAVGSVFLFENTMQMFSEINKYLYYAPVFEFLIPLIILIPLKIKLRKRRLPKQAQGV